MSSEPFVDCLSSIRRNILGVLQSPNISSEEQSLRRVEEIANSLEELRVYSGSIELTELTIDEWPPQDGEDTLIAECLHLMYEEDSPRATDIEQASLSELVESDRVLVDSGFIYVPLSYDRQHIRNWGVLFDFIYTELSSLEPKFQRVKRRIAADKDEDLLTQWKEISDNFDRVCMKHKEYSEYFSPVDEIPQEIRERRARYEQQ